MMMVMNPWIPNHLNNFGCFIKVSCRSFSMLSLLFEGWMGLDCSGNVALDGHLYQFE